MQLGFRLVVIAVSLYRCRSFFVKQLKFPNYQRFSSQGNSSAPSALAPLSIDLLRSLYPVEDGLASSSESDGAISKSFLPTGQNDLAQLEKVKAGKGKNELKFALRSETSRRYFEIVDKLSPNELLQKFAATAPKNVQEATKSTIVSILGNLPNYALDAGMITTSSKLANLLYQMQITGYMFKNAEYRMTLTQTLKGLPKLPSQTVINKGNISFSPSQNNVVVSGEALVRTSSGETVKVNVNELMGALSKEVDDLRNELALLRNERELELRSNLLTYIQALPERDLNKLTSSMSEDVLQSIQMLVDGLMERLGIDTTGPEVMLQQNVAVLAQLCMWQMVIGYKLRELEALDQGINFSADE